MGDYKQAIYGFRGSDITLTKAVVDRIATGENGCDTETLDTSYRSLPGIVEVCNETFKRTFKGVLDEGAIVLKTHRTNDEKIRSVRLWDMEEPESVGIADHIAYLLTKSSKTKGPDGKPVEMAGFPYHALDTYLPKLIRAGERVAICDQLENPRATAKRNSEESSQENKQEVKEVVAPAKKQEEEQHRGVHR